MKVRFAPSPTGYIHVGNCRTLLINWLFARHHGAEFILRLDDTDKERNEKRYEDALLEDLRWLGFSYDRYVKQSDRIELYAAAVSKLKSNGRLYACYETPQELEFKRRHQVAQGLPPLYDRGSLHLSKEEKQKYIDEGRTPHWRFLILPEDVTWNDMVRGPLHFEGSKLSDPVLIREDGMPIYTLASVVDDHDMGITHIIRGEDHIANTAVQLQIFKALGADLNALHFGHLSLLQNADGGELSKRLGTGSIRDLRQDGILPMAISSILAKIGTSDPIQPFGYLRDLIQTFDMEKFSRGTPKFSMTELEMINQKLLHQLSLTEARAHSGLSYIDEDFWVAVRPNLKTLQELKEWWAICREDKKTKASEPEFIKIALYLLPPMPWTETIASDWLNAVKEQTGRKGKDLFMPLRQALTGHDRGPEFGLLLNLMGHDLTKRRLENSLR
jgi:glutamyl-tRNA synthetase